MFIGKPEQRVFLPDEVAIIRRAFERACLECTLTGDHGRQAIARILFARYRHGADEAELVRLTKRIIALQRGLRTPDRAA